MLIASYGLLQCKVLQQQPGGRTGMLPVTEDGSISRPTQPVGPSPPVSSGTKKVPRDIMKVGL